MLTDHGWTSQVHREYGAGDGRRLDLVVLPADQLENADRFYKGTDHRHVHPEFGFEFGTEKIGDDALAHVGRDLEKLQDCGRGYLVHVFRDMAVADTGTKSRKKTQARLDRVFCDGARGLVVPPNVAVVLMVVGVARTEKKVRGRCRLLIAKKWRPVNANDVGRWVRNLLASEASG